MAIVSLAIVHTGSFPHGSCSHGNCPLGNCPRTQIGYNDSIRDEFTLIERRIDISPAANSDPPLQPPMAVKIPKLECKIFDGTSKDKLEFKNFLTQFFNCIDACGTLSNANKLNYLRSYYQSSFGDR